MSFNAEWDVDKYKTEYESEEHWQLRRSFMMTHKNKFPEDRLVCLAQVFTNVEFLGCRYPAETMELIGQLSEGVADGYREKQKTKLQRTFIKASDAAGAKVKGLKRPLGDAAGQSDSPPKIPKCADITQLPQINISTTPDTSKISGNIQLPQTTISSTADTPKGVEQKQIPKGVEKKQISKGVEHKLLLQNNISSTTETPKCSETMQLPQKTVSSTAWVVTDTDSSVQSTSVASQLLKTCAFIQAAEPSKMLSKENKQESNDIEINGCEENTKTVREDDRKLTKKEAKTNCKSNSRRLKKDNSKVESYRDLDSEMALIHTGKFGRLILLEDMGESSPLNVLTHSTTHCRIPFRIEYGGKTPCCKILVNGHVVVSVSDTSKKIAREVAVSCALEKLKDVCYTLKVKKQRVPEDLVVDMAMITSVELSAPRESRAPIPKAAALTTPLPEDNIGSKLMRSMGWTGGGLGKAEQGIQEPVSVSLRVNRAGLGAQKKFVDSSFKAKARLYLLKYLVQDFPSNLIFMSNEFSSPERDVIHQIAKALGLLSKSVGKGDETYLKISRKDPLHIIAAIMLRRGVYSDEFCELLKPRNPSSVNYEPESLQASDFPHLCHQKSSSRVDHQNNDGGSHPPESNVIGRDLGKHLVKSLSQKERKRERRKEKTSRRAASRRSERIIDKQCGHKTSKPYALDAIAAGPYGSFFLIEYENENLHKSTIMYESARNNFVPVTYHYGSFKTGA